MSALANIALSLNVALLAGLALSLPGAVRKRDGKMIAACVLFGLPAAFAVAALAEQALS